MNTIATLTILAALAISAVGHAAQQAPDVLALASRSGVNMTAPATITFEWTRPEEGLNAKEAGEALQAARFVVTTSITKKPDPARTEYKLSAQWTGVLQEAQMQRVITRVAALTAGQGSVKWQVTQASR